MADPGTVVVKSVATIPIEKVSVIVSEITSVLG